jgi:hypothetical protein
MRITTMTSETEDVTWTGRTWHIVRADLDLAHVFLPLSNFTFEPTTNKKGLQAYKIVHTNQLSTPDCFSDAVFVALGVTRPTSQAIAKKMPLPLFSKDSASVYSEVTDTLIDYMDRNRELQRLEGEIKIPCHAHGAKLHKEALADHPTQWVKTLLHIYQFGNVVEGNLPLIVFRAPLSPVCPMNADGSAAGYSH